MRTRRSYIEPYLSRVPLSIPATSAGERINSRRTSTVTPSMTLGAMARAYRSSRDLAGYAVRPPRVGIIRATTSGIGHPITSPTIRNTAKLRPLRSAKRAVSTAGTTQSAHTTINPSTNATSWMGWLNGSLPHRVRAQASLHVPRRPAPRPRRATARIHASCDRLFRLESTCSLTGAPPGARSIDPTGVEHRSAARHVRRRYVEAALPQASG
jgi:hypothetical protein